MSSCFFLNGAPFAYKTTKISVPGLFAGNGGLEDVLAADDPDSLVVDLDGVDDRVNIAFKDVGVSRVHGRIYTASDVVDWIASERSYPGQPRFTTIKTIVSVLSRVEHADRCSFKTRFYISSAPLDIDRLAGAVRGHLGIESMHWLLEVAFKDDLSRYRSGHGARNMAVVRRFALGRANKDKGSVKTRRKTAACNPEFLMKILQLKSR